MAGTYPRMPKGVEAKSPSPHRPAPVAIRRVWPAEYAAWRAHLKRLDPGSRRSRFFSPVNDAFLDAYVDRAHGQGAIVYGGFVDGEMRAAGELRLLGEPWPHSAESALSVEMDWQDEGVGTRLLGRLITVARNRGITSLTMICQLDNARMRRLAGKCRAELTFEEGSITGLIARPWPDFVSWLEEAVEESHSFATALLRWPDAERSAP